MRDRVPLFRQERFYMENLAIIRRELSSTGLQIHDGEPAASIRIKTPEGVDSWDFFDLLLSKADVAPGSGFGSAGEDHFRLSTYRSRETMNEVMRRIQAVQGS